MNYFIAFLIIILVLWIFIVLKFSKNKKLDLYVKNELNNNFNKVKSNSSSKMRVIDFDKLYHKILFKLWYNWTFWEILKSNPKVINDINKIWELHKLRNKLVHDFDNISETILSKRAKEYQNIITELLKRI